jgi:hypothetical protein
VVGTSGSTEERLGLPFASATSRLSRTSESAATTGEKK